LVARSWTALRTHKVKKKDRVAPAPIENREPTIAELRGSVKILRARQKPHADICWSYEQLIANLETQIEQRRFPQ
jgi:hypothetical protein